MAQQVTERVRHTLDASWRILRNPWLLLASLAMLVLLILSATVLPQMPGQVHEEPAAAVRFENSAADDFGWAGPLLVAAGLFHLLSSPLLFALLAWVTLLVAVQLVDTMIALVAGRGLTEAFHGPVGADALPLRTPDPLFRARFASTSEMQSTFTQITEWAASRYADIQTTVATSSSESGSPAESRLLGRTHHLLPWIRPLLPLGALLLTVPIWSFALTGWDVTPDTLAPGDSYANSKHEFSVDYVVPIAGADGALTISPSAVITLGDYSRALQPVDGSTAIGSARVSLATGAPGLYLTATQPLLSRPGYLEARPSLGLLFPQTGSEQLVLLPTLGAGLRMVRLGNETSEPFLVEVYGESEDQPLQRIELTSTQTITIAAQRQSIALRLQPLSGLDITVRSWPQQWMVWPAFLLLLAGLVSLVRPPAFLLVQVSEWPESRAAVTAQSSRRRDIRDLTSHLSPPAPESASRESPS